MTRVVRSWLLFLIPVALCTVALGARTRESSYEAFYIFGDSLADTGNTYQLSLLVGIDPAVPPSVSPHQTYFQGRFSNGPVAVEHLWALIKQAPVGPGITPVLEARVFPRTGALSFAFGGSGTGYVSPLPDGQFVPGLKTQVELFRIASFGRRPGRNTLYTIVSGANDYIVPEGSAPASPQQVVNNIEDAIEALYALGAREVLLWNVPDLGQLPLTSGSPASAGLTQLSQAHNLLLAQAAQGLRSRLRGLRLIEFDFGALFAQLPPGAILDQPALDVLLPPLPGLPPSSLCLFVAPQTCRDVPTFEVDPAFLFWDAEHPTTAAHLFIAQALFQLLGAR